MNKSFILSLALLAFSLGAAAQNQYWNYRSNWYITHPTSTACIAHSDGKVYFFQTDPNHMISVAQINASNMQLTSPWHHLCRFDNMVTIRGGTTQNEEMVRLSDLHGFFLIHAVDEEGNEDVKKIVIFD